jgi:hypothetical protein
MSDFAIRPSAHSAAAETASHAPTGRHARSRARAHRRGTGSREFWLYFAISFPIFLTIAVLARLLPRAWRPGMSELRGEGSVFGEAKAAANKVLPFVFMS